MTAYFGSNATKRRATPPQAVDLGDQGGRVRHTYDEVATTTAMTTADTIELGLLPSARASSACRSAGWRTAPAAR